MFRPVVCSLLALSFISIVARPSLACPFCLPQTTLTEEIALSQAAFAVQYVSGKDGDVRKGLPGATHVRITQIFRNSDPPRQVGDVIDLDLFFDARPGELFLLFGRMPEGTSTIKWNPLMPASLALIDYLNGRPAADIPLRERLPYFVKFFEHPEETIAVDAYSEFGVAPYVDVKAIADRFPREKLHQWVKESDSATGRVARMGFYGMLLGLCGNADDARMMEQVILTPGADFADIRIGIDGVMAGYLMLTRDKGLRTLEQFAFSPNTADSERLALHQATRFLWDFGEGRIAKELLRSTVRRFVDDPTLAELAITDLTRWEDLTLVDRLIKLLDDPRYADRYLSIAITRYYLTISELDPAGRSTEEREAIALAGRHLQTIRTRDPELVERADRIPR
jgi:hypothetical protein